MFCEYSVACFLFVRLLCQSKNPIFSLWGLWVLIKNTVCYECTSTIHRMAHNGIALVLFMSVQRCALETWNTSISIYFYDNSLIQTSLAEYYIGCDMSVYFILTDFVFNPWWQIVRLVITKASYQCLQYLYIILQPHTHHIQALLLADFYILAPVMIHDVVVHGKQYTRTFIHNITWQTITEHPVCLHNLEKYANPLINMSKILWKIYILKP